MSAYICPLWGSSDLDLVLISLKCIRGLDYVLYLIALGPSVLVFCGPAGRLAMSFFFLFIYIKPSGRLLLIFSPSSFICFSFFF